jgi:hypothetical protein
VSIVLIRTASIAHGMCAPVMCAVSSAATNAPICRGVANAKATFAEIAKTFSPVSFVSYPPVIRAELSFIVGRVKYLLANPAVPATTEFKKREKEHSQLQNETLKDEDVQKREDEYNCSEKA